MTETPENTTFTIRWPHILFGWTAFGSFALVRHLATAWEQGTPIN